MYYRRDLWNYIMFPQIPSHSRFRIMRMPGTLRQGSNLIVIISWFSKWTLIDKKKSANGWNKIHKLSIPE